MESYKPGDRIAVLVKSSQRESAGYRPEIATEDGRLYELLYIHELEDHQELPDVGDLVVLECAKAKWDFYSPGHLMSNGHEAQFGIWKIVDEAT